MRFTAVKNDIKVVFAFFTLLFVVLLPPSSHIEAKVAIDVLGRSGRFIVYNDTLSKDDDPDRVMITFDYIYEINEDGETVVGNKGPVHQRHSLDTFAKQNFTINDPVETELQGITAERISFNTNVNSFGNLAIDVYIMQGIGTINTTTDESFDVVPNDVKFNIMLSNWIFCDPCLSGGRRPLDRFNMGHGGQGHGMQGQGGQGQGMQGQGMQGQGMQGQGMQGQGMQGQGGQGQGQRGQGQGGGQGGQGQGQRGQGQGGQGQREQGGQGQGQRGQGQGGQGQGGGNNRFLQGQEGNGVQGGNRGQNDNGGQGGGPPPVQGGGDFRPFNATSSFIEIAIAMKGKGSRPNRRKRRGDRQRQILYDLGGNVPLSLSSNVQVDGNWEQMMDGFPVIEQVRGGMDVFIFRFPKFENNLFYDPIVGSSGQNPMIADSDPWPEEEEEVIISDGATGEGGGSTIGGENENESINGKKEEEGEGGNNDGKKDSVDKEEEPNIDDNGGGGFGDDGSDSVSMLLNTTTSTLVAIFVILLFTVLP